MTRDATPLYIDDVSRFTKSLRKSLASSETLPGHTAMLNLIARAAGQPNYQAVKAAAPARAPDNPARLKQALRCYDPTGHMIHWPKKTMVQALCLWPFWAMIPPHVELSEPAINDLIKTRLGMEDYPLIRRSLIDHGLVRREIDGRAYQRIEQVPPSDALVMIKTIITS